MAKERFLTVLVPIKDDDCVNAEAAYASKQALESAIPVNMDNINNLYKVRYISSGNTVVEYYRYIPEIDNAHYTLVVDREFPYLGKPLEIFDFTYDATRMGQAPTISAQNVMWFAEKDADGNYVTLEAKWIEFGQQCHVTFNGENYYLKQIPTSSKSNEDARYKYDIDFISERAVLETVYLYDVVQPYITEKPISESATFSFYGDVSELAKRINASLMASALAFPQDIRWVPYPTDPTERVPHLTYQQWNLVGVDYEILIDDGVFQGQYDALLFKETIYEALNGNYNAYLNTYVYDLSNGLAGYQCRLGNDKYGNPITSEEKLITFENNTIHEALQRIFDEYGLQYYVEKEKDANGRFTGNTIIWIADCQHDFADWDEENYDYVRDNDDVPTTEHPFDYGTDFSDKYNKSTALLSKEKTNTTDKIITRITGIGSTENIPWYYPNPTADGWIKPKLKTHGQEVSGVTIDYPTSEGSTPAESTRYEKYLKNRIGNNLQYGKVVEMLSKYSWWVEPKQSQETVGGQTLQVINVTYRMSAVDVELLLEQPADWSTNYGGYYVLNDDGTYSLNTNTTFAPDKYYKITPSVINPKVTMELDIKSQISNLRKFTVSLVNGGSSQSYDSSVDYQYQSDFQTMCSTRDGQHYVQYIPNIYEFRFKYYLSQMPTTQQYDGEGYRIADKTKKLTFSNTSQPLVHHYYRMVGQNNYQWSESMIIIVHTGENFYKHKKLEPYVDYVDNSYSPTGQAVYHEITIRDAGMSVDGTAETKVDCFPRIEGRKYFDLDDNHIYVCTTSNAVAWMYVSSNGDIGTYLSAYSISPNMTPAEWVESFANLKMKLHQSDSWYLGAKAVQLADYGINGITKTGGYTPDIFDTIEFSRVKYITPQPNLMPEVYIKTDGERRFYNAHNYYPLQLAPASGADSAIGEVLITSGTDNGKVYNPLYKENENDANDKHYVFENEYMQNVPREHIEEFDDIKPTITEQKNYIPVSIASSTQFDSIKTSLYYKSGSSYVQCTSSTRWNQDTQYFAQLRIDVVDSFAYDTTDNDEIWENNDNGSISGEYKHPYFFARLRPLGFNIFDLALQDDMVLSMTTGHCGACNFKIAVDENTKKNTVQIWEHDVYLLEASGSYSSNPKYTEGELRRYVDETNLYYKIDDAYIPINSGLHIIEGGFLDTYASTTRMYQRYTYSDEDITNGLVGSAKNENVVHFEGDVMTSGRYIDVQQDTTENFVWIALTKDTDTYGTIMPAARPDYANDNFSVYIRPASIQDVHTSGSTFAQDDENADKFVFTNIKLPQVYLRRAERDLSRKLVAYMYDNNYQKFNFSVKFSRIFLAQNEQIDADLNENSVLYVSFNNQTYRQYVKHYSYRMTHDAVLPEITVDMNDTLPLSRTSIERQAAMQLKNNKWTTAQVQSAVKQAKQEVSARTIGKNSTNIIAGNIVNRANRTSLVSLGNTAKQQTQQIETMRESMASDYYKRKDFTIENGTDLNIGGEKFLPTAYNTQGVLRKRKWDYDEGKFVEDVTQKLAPAFINKTDKSLYDVHEDYHLLDSEPADFTINYANYYKLVGNDYTPLEEAETFAANTYYQRVEGAVDNTIVPARVSGKQIAYGLNGVLKPLVMQSNVISERNYILLERGPQDWATAWTNYYKKNENGEFVRLTDPTVPTFVENTYYKEEATEYDLKQTEEYNHIIAAFDQMDIALHCAQVTVQSNGHGGYTATFTYNLPEERQDPTDERPDRCPAMDGDFWFRTATDSERN